LDKKLLTYTGNATNLTALLLQSKLWMPPNRLEELQDLTEDDWSIKCEEITDEHKLDHAPNDLIVGWKAWILDHWPNKGGITSRIERPADGLKTLVHNE
jgi:hypothetical protein